MPIVKMNVRTRYRGRAVQKGDEVEVTDAVARRWMTGPRPLAAAVEGRRGRVIDATGSSIARSTESPRGNEYPDGFPGARELREAGVTPDRVRQMTEDELREVHGIGRATAAKIVAER